MQGEGRGLNAREGEGSECKGRRPEGVEGNGEEGWEGHSLRKVGSSAFFVGRMVMR